jgi:predicted RNA polymerase sigma factor
VAVAYDKGPEAGLQLLDVENVGLFAVQNWHLFWSTRAELLQREPSCCNEPID